MKVGSNFCGLLLCGLLYGVVLGEANWPQFRGPEALGISENPDLPVRWSSTENVLWRVDDAGRGWSSPVVWGDRVFITTVVNHGESEDPKKGLYFGGNRPKPPATEHEWKVECLDLNSGKVQWQHVIDKAVPAKGLHVKNS